ncbi:protein serine/threonine phosphatase 2C [Marasmius fiardii PR-910]|nr:protein serine/threonine phosphatase 2C [Marasmius fiardii PR-910]
MLRRAWKPVVASAVTGGTAYYFYTSSTRQTFELPVKVIGADGKPTMTNKQMPLLPMQVLNERLKQNATSETVRRPDGVTWHYSTASLPSNNPIEDASSHQIVQRDPDPEGKLVGDYLFFSVFDGHRGPETSQLLSRVLINAVALELSQLVSNAEQPSRGVTHNLTSLLWTKSSTTPPQSITYEQKVTAAIERAFTSLDYHLLNAPLTLLKEAIQNQPKKDQVPDLSKHPMGLKTMLPAISGSCALMAIFDSALNDLYVACAGDSRAVAGTWNQGADGRGVWSVDVLSEDQTGRNPNEARRIISEHPKEEAVDVIRNGRILGGLEPSRAFGDARYKWPAEIQEVLNQVFMVGNDMPLRKAPTTLKTPPYVTARPVVTHRKLSFEDPSSSKCFLVIATDGLWDALSSQEVVSLVGGFLSGLRGNVSKRDLPSLAPTVTGNPGIDGKEKRTKVDNGTWAFVDDNVSAHLIRNALGGGDEIALRRLMSIPAPYARRYRDDITVTVVWWENGQPGNAQSTTVDIIKSKL